MEISNVYPTRYKQQIQTKYKQIQKTNKINHDLNVKAMNRCEKK